MSRNATASLFDDEPGAKFSLVEVLAHSKPITKAQLSFQRLVAKIDGKREQLKQWQACVLRYQQRLAGEMMPLQEELREGQRQMAILIDQLLSQPATDRRLGRVQRAKLRQLLMNLLAGLLEENADDEAMEALHDKHGEVPHAQARQAELELTQAMLEGIFGVEVGDDHGATNTEELLQHARRKMQEQAEAQARLAQERLESRVAKRSKASSGKAAAAQAKREQDALEASLSLREVYRKLASALHPDRETDADARQRKTRLMQRVNDAYAANDLLTLLGLQLEIEQIDAEHLASVSPQRLAHFSQILREQLAELDAELAHCVQPFRNAVGWGRNPTPAMADLQLSADIATLKSAVREIQQDLEAFRDPARLRDSLKHYPLEHDDGDGPGDLTGLLGLFAGHAPAPRGKRRRG